jgi:hypothetical protein
LPTCEQRVAYLIINIIDLELESTFLEQALNTLRERRVTAELPFRMDHTVLAVSMAAHMVIYEQVRLPQFVKFRRCLLDTFIDMPNNGSLLVGDHAIPSDKLFTLIISDCTSSSFPGLWLGTRPLCEDSSI